MKPDVSIIVPVYNTEDYLPRCLDSLAKQTLRHTEFLLVIDKNSNEESRRITEEYCAHDSRFQLVNADANGASAVRNTGLRLAQGEYVGFVDSDDYALPEMYSSLFSFASHTAVDIAVSGIYRNKANSQELQTLILYPEETTSISNTTRLRFLYQWVLSPQANPVWNKLYRNDFLVRHGLFFDESVQMGEDAAFNTNCFALASSAGSIDQANYVYFNRPGSITYVIEPEPVLRDFERRWHCFHQVANTIPDGKSLLAVASLRLIANSIFFFKTRNRTLEEACTYAAHMIASLRMQPYLEFALRPGILTEFERATRMDAIAASHFRMFAEAASKGKNSLLEWQLYYQNAIEKRG